MKKHGTVGQMPIAPDAVGLRNVCGVKRALYCLSSSAECGRAFPLFPLSSAMISEQQLLLQHHHHIILIIAIVTITPAFSLLLTC
jgi:hypothetical protein